jgi:hypothetical protein
MTQDDVTLLRLFAVEGSESAFGEVVCACRVLHSSLKIIAASSHDTGNGALVKAGASTVCGKMEFNKIKL